VELNALVNDALFERSGGAVMAVRTPPEQLLAATTGPDGILGDQAVMWVRPKAFRHEPLHLRAAWCACPRCVRGDPRNAACKPPRPAAEGYASDPTLDTRPSRQVITRESGRIDVPGARRTRSPVPSTRKIKPAEAGFLLWKPGDFGT